MLTFHLSSWIRAAKGVTPIPVAIHRLTLYRQTSWKDKHPIYTSWDRIITNAIYAIRPLERWGEEGEWGRGVTERIHGWDQRQNFKYVCHVSSLVNKWIIENYFFQYIKKNSEQRWNNSSYRARTSVWAIHRNSCFKKRHYILIYEILKLPSPHPLLTSCLTEKYLSIITYSSQSCTNIYFRETGASLQIISVHYSFKVVVCLSTFANFFFFNF